jgi:GT2 family glycosyltransferase
MSHPRITVISVSWRSAEFLRDLFARLLAFAEQPDTIRLLVADNTGGADAELATLDCPNLTIVFDLKPEEDRATNTEASQPKA